MKARPPAGQPLTFETAEAQVLGNLRAQGVGAATVADLAMPEAFLRRVAGRVLQLSFQENFRLVVADRPGAVEHEPWRPGDRRAELASVQVEAPETEFPDGPVASAPARGFLPSVLAGDASLPYAPAGDQHLAEVVSRGLARDGLLTTALKVINLLGGASQDTGTLMGALRDAGFPTDLLQHFEVPGADQRGAATTLAWLQDTQRTVPAPKLAKALQQAQFRFRATAAGFRAVSDSGGLRPQLARVQLSRGGYWFGPGDGGSVDVVRQVLDSLEGTRVIASIESRHLDDLRSALVDCPPDQTGRLSIITHPFTLSQWAQDNGKTGLDASGHVVLIPRYATRGEEVSLYVPGDTYAARGLVRAAVPVAHSPLLFQGGNLQVVQEPEGRRILLIGEAEVYRNQSLGLTREQVIAALTTELGCDRGVILPAASMHLDYEVSCRTRTDRVIAFVVDSVAGARGVVTAAAEAMTRRGLLESTAAGQALRQVVEGRAFEGCRVIWGALNRHAVGPGRYPIGLAPVFREGPSDSGVGNMHRLMAALDLLVASDPRSQSEVQDSNLRVYLRSLQKRQEDRSQLRTTLKGLGWTVVPVPGIAQGDRSINPLNGLHTPDAYLMPAYGGLYKGLDSLAASAMSAILGKDVRIVPIRTGESQRRDGALRCSVSLV